MFKKVIIKNFKRLKDVTVDLHPKTLSLVVGGNNSGKSTLLHAIAVWQFCRTAIEYEKGSNALLSTFHGAGLGITIDDFTPLNIPSFKYLWTNLNPGNSYTLFIDCFWEYGGIEKHLCIGLALNQEKLYIKNNGSNLQMGDKIPIVAYVPPFAGIVNKEQWYAPAMRNRLIGQGLAGSVLRNQIMELYIANQKMRNEKKGDKKKMLKRDLEWIRENDSYELLNQTIFRVFKGILYPESFNPSFHTHVSIGFRKGEIKNNRFAPYKNYAVRDIMAEGSGFLQWLSVYTFALSPNIDILLLDEPDAHLHCSLQNELLNVLKEISDKKEKQVIVATHSTEVIKESDHRDILYADQGKYKYLGDASLKAKVMSGLGTEYFLLFDDIQRYKKILFVENPSDAKILKLFCNKYSSWPKNIVIWPDVNSHIDRKGFFMELHSVIPGLKAISLHDRDNGPYEQTHPDLSTGGMSDWKDNPPGVGEIRFRTWRRWEIESYLMGVPAMRRLYKGNNPTLSEKDADSFIDSQLTAISVAVNPDYLQSERTTSNQSLFQNDAKAMLYPLLNQLGLDKWDVINEMKESEIFADVRTLLDEIVTFSMI